MSEKKIAGTYFAPGSKADHDYGVSYQGDYQHLADGTSVAVRLHARALALTGMPVLLRSFSAEVLTRAGIYEPMHAAGLEEEVLAEIRPNDDPENDLRNTSASKLPLSVKHFVVHKPEQLHQRLMRGVMGALDDPEKLMAARKVIYSQTVLFSVWERDRIDRAMARELSRLGGNWVPCEQNAEMLREAGVENVTVMPHPYDPEDPLAQLVRRDPKKIRGKRFYAIGRWEPRKGFAELLETFLLTFAPGEEAWLTIKSHGRWKGYPTAQEVIGNVLAGPNPGGWTAETIEEHVMLIDGFCSRSRIRKLHYMNNIYVCCSHGEAWCLPAFEAKVAGNIMIHVPYGGTADFCDGRDRELPFKMGPVPESYNWTKGSQWAVWSLVHLRRELIDIRAPEKFERAPTFQALFSLRSVGYRMADSLLAILPEGRARTYLKGQML